MMEQKAVGRSFTAFFLLLVVLAHFGLGFFVGHLVLVLLFVLFSLAVVFKIPVILFVLGSSSDNYFIGRDVKVVWDVNVCSFSKFPDVFVVELFVVSPQVAGVDVCWRHDVRVVEDGDDAHDDTFDTLCWRPVFVRRLILVDVARLVEDGDAHPSVGVDVWVEDRRRELERRWREGVVEREVHLGLQVGVVPW